MRWATTHSEEEIRVARDRSLSVGTAVHAAIESAIHGSDNPERHLALASDEYRKEADRAFRSWLTWRASEDGARWTFLGTELPLVSEKGRYGGTLDVLARDELTGELCVGDWKTSGDLHVGAFYQLAGYADAWDREPISGGFVVRLHTADVGYQFAFPPEAVWEATRKQWRSILRSYVIERQLVGVLQRARR